MRKNDELCDVTISVGQKKIRAHKLVLAASSPYFMSMFRGGFHESNQSEVTIGRDVVDEEAMETLIDFCYTNNIEVDKSNMQALIATACYLHMYEIKVS